MVSPQAQQQPHPEPEAYATGQMIKNAQLVREAWKTTENPEPTPENRSSAHALGGDAATIATPLREERVTLHPRRSFGVLKSAKDAPTTNAGVTTSPRESNDKESSEKGRAVFQIQLDLQNRTGGGGGSKTPIPLGSQALETLALNSIRKSEGRQKPTSTSSNSTLDNPISPPKWEGANSQVRVQDESEGYTCNPPLEELNKMTSEELAVLEGFVIKKGSVGSIHWKVPVDVRGLVIGKDVVISQGSIEVYPKDKVSVGEGLNRAATCESVIDLPEDVAPANTESFLKYFVENDLDAPARFVRYETSSSTLVFDVDHF